MDDNTDTEDEANDEDNDPKPVKNFLWFIF